MATFASARSESRQDKGKEMRSLLFASAAMAAVIVHAPGAAAQEAGNVKLDEVVVTAQRRSENLQKTPLTVSAVTGDKLEAQGIKTVIGRAHV